MTSYIFALLVRKNLKISSNLFVLLAWIINLQFIILVWAKEGISFSLLLLVTESSDIHLQDEIVNNVKRSAFKIKWKLFIPVFILFVGFNFGKVSLNNTLQITKL